MTDITGTWATIPDCPKYECLYDQSKGIKIRFKKVAAGVRNGIQCGEKRAGNHLWPGKDGMVAIKNHPNMMPSRWAPQELWDHTFKGKRLITPSERKETRMREAAERKAAMALNKIT